MKIKLIITYPKQLQKTTKSRDLGLIPTLSPVNAKRPQGERTRPLEGLPALHELRKQSREKF
jgi:hypothetical protein